MPANCPACGQALRTLPPGLSLSPLELGLYNILKKAGDDGIIVLDIAGKLYRDYVNGGPENANKVVHILKMSLNKKLKGARQRVITTHRGHGSRFVLEVK